MKDYIVFSDGLTIDFSKRLISCNHKIITLAKKEFDIVALLARNSGKIFDRNQIYEIVWAKTFTGKSNVVSEHIRRIRTKISPYSDIDHIETIWRLGYKWVQDPFSSTGDHSPMS